MRLFFAKDRRLFSNPLAMGLQWLLLFALLYAIVSVALRAETKPEPPKLDAEQRAEAYEILYGMRDAQAKARDLRLLGQKELEKREMQAAELDQAANEAYARFDALQKKLAGDSGCTLSPKLEWQCQAERPQPAPPAKSN